MRAVPVTEEVKELAFDFHGAGNLPSPNTGHQHHLVIRFEDENHITETWTWRQDGMDMPMIFHLTGKGKKTRRGQAGWELRTITGCWGLWPATDERRSGAPRSKSRVSACELYAVAICNCPPSSRACRRFPCARNRAHREEGTWICSRKAIDRGRREC